MAHRDDAGAARRGVPDFLIEESVRGRVKACARLVQKQDARLLQEDAGKAEALLHAAREDARAGQGVTGKPHVPEHVRKRLSV